MKHFHADMQIKVLIKYYKLFHELLNVLISLAYVNSVNNPFLGKYRHMIAELIGDSGAWSKVKGTSNLTLEQVISLFKMIGHKFDRYFNFDDDFSEQGFEHNHYNLCKMEQEDLEPIAVIHNFFTKEIEYYAGCGKYEWLALGSSQSTKFENIQYAVHKIKKINPDLKIHWFGGSKFEWLIKLPIASCDSSSWGKTSKFGNINFWNPEEPKLNKTHTIYVGGRIGNGKDSKYHFNTYPWRNDLENYLWENFGLTYRDLCGYEGFTNMGVVNTRFYVELENHINQERIKRGVPLE